MAFPHGEGDLSSFSTKIAEKRLLEDSRYVSVEVQVALFLYAVSKNATNRTLQDRFQYGAHTISTYFHAVLNAIT